MKPNIALVFVWTQTNATKYSSQVKMVSNTYIFNGEG